MKIRKNKKCCGNCYWDIKGWCYNGDIKIRVKQTDDICDFKGNDGFRLK